MKVTKENLIKSWNAEGGFENPQLFIKAYHLAEETSLAVKRKLKNILLGKKEIIE